MFIWLQKLGLRSEKTAHAQPTSIGRWVLLRMALLLVSLGAVFILVAIYLLNQRFDSVDEKQYKNDAFRVSANI